jgi:4'-phosphopantetheinyl transferase
MILIGPTEAHIWHVRIDQVQDTTVLDWCTSLLSREERGRQERFHFPEHRHQFLVSHAFVRCVLSEYTGTPPADWSFVVGRHGKPAIAGPPAGRRFRFNLSHSTGLAAVAVTDGWEIGIDVENVDRRQTGLDLAGRWFAAEEVAQLRSLEPASQPGAFFEFWTLKESYIKARGLGLAIPLDQFAFRLHPGATPTIAFSAELPDDPAAWQFAQFRITASHQLAVAIHRPGVPDLTIKLMGEHSLQEPMGERDG